MNSRIILLTFFLLACSPSLRAQEKPLTERAGIGLKKAVAYMRENVATGGGYLWTYSADLKQREGEGKASNSTVWVQPPGTPSVGLAYLRAYEATDDRYYLYSAQEVGLALTRGQLRSGGWDYRIEFSPKTRNRYAYRQIPTNKGGRNVTTLDDNNTQEALRMMMRLDRALKFRDAEVHEVTLYALRCLLKAQYPNGAWPQRYSEFPDPKKYPVKRANYPQSWSRKYPAKRYQDYYTLNDNAQADVIDVMFEAARIYGEEKYRQAALKGADFFLLAQMPDPQPIWAQQYNHDMQPAWARRFEPASVTGGESQGVMWTLIQVYRRTGDKKYLQPIPRALAYLNKVKLANGQLARFYELKTHKPLYFTKKYELVYSDNDLPTHYGFKVSSSKLDRIDRELKRLQSLPRDQLLPRPSNPRVSKSMKQRVEAVLKAQDKLGRWLEKGELRSQKNNDPTGQVLSCRTFIRNLDVLSTYLRAAK